MPHPTVDQAHTHSDGGEDWASDSAHGQQPSEGSAERERETLSPPRRRHGAHEYSIADSPYWGTIGGRGHLLEAPVHVSWGGDSDDEGDIRSAVSALYGAYPIDNGRLFNLETGLCYIHIFTLVETAEGCAGRDSPGVSETDALRGTGSPDSRRGGTEPRFEVVHEVMGLPPCIQALFQCGEVHHAYVEGTSSVYCYISLSLDNSDHAAHHVVVLSLDALLTRAFTLPPEGRVQVTRGGHVVGKGYDLECRSLGSHLIVWGNVEGVGTGGTEGWDDHGGRHMWALDTEREAEGFTELTLGPSPSAFIVPEVVGRGNFTVDPLGLGDTAYTMDEESRLWSFSLSRGWVRVESVYPDYDKRDWTRWFTRSCAVVGQYVAVGPVYCSKHDKLYSDACLAAYDTVAGSWRLWPIAKASGWFCFLLHSFYHNVITTFPSHGVWIGQTQYEMPTALEADPGRVYPHQDMGWALDAPMAEVAAVQVMLEKEREREREAFWNNPDSSVSEVNLSENTDERHDRFEREERRRYRHRRS
ncbi:hypothetical protein KIPB_009360 [Kipferlia bialata]|uniref:Uncharacterized protein n=1 Tax=Kipferlia bialata TaxID=797122 RepID=A0A9K3GLI6_9EUKA|nr:hypothetical protein KIPB_009360 [Kipferlia bialata]|eukprot:g9360.t1